MITLALTALAGTLACTGTDDRAHCIMLTEVRTRTPVHRRSCSGLESIQKLYSVDVEGWLVCLPLDSLVAGPAAVRTPDPESPRRPQPSNAPAAAPRN
jgi:hypothetical protein